VVGAEKRAGTVTSLTIVKRVNSKEVDSSCGNPIIVRQNGEYGSENYHHYASISLTVVALFLILGI
jgi:hypothetical protein